MEEINYLQGKLSGKSLRGFQQKIIEGNFNYSVKLAQEGGEDSSQNILNETEETLKAEDFFFIQRLKLRDRKAQLRLYRVLHPKVEKHILANSGSVEDAKDFTQEVIIKLYNKLLTDASKITNLIGFALGILKYDWLKELHKRKRQSEKTIELPEELIKSDVEFEDIEIAETEDCEKVILKESLEQLKPDQKSFIEYYDLKEHSIKETALHFKMDLGSVRVKANRVRNYLHKKMTNHPQFNDCFKK